MKLIQAQQNRPPDPKIGLGSIIWPANTRSGETPRDVRKVIGAGDGKLYLIQLVEAGPAAVVIADQTAATRDLDGFLRNHGWEPVPVGTKLTFEV